MEERGSINKELFKRLEELGCLKEVQDIEDPTIREFKAKERFDLEHHAVNRHDRRAIKAKYRKLRQKKNIKLWKKEI